MRRATIMEYDKLADKLSKYVGQMNFRFMDLCVKAEPGALLSVQVFIEGELLKLEDCAKIAKPDDFHFMLIPQYDEDLVPIQKAVLYVPPEFKMKVDTLQVDTVDEDGVTENHDVRYLNVTMPEVDDDRYDVLTNAAKGIYEECKVFMETANNTSKAKFATLAPGETPDDLDKLDKALKRLNKDWDTQRDKLYEKKLKEIEDAHDKWLLERNERNKLRQEEEAARNEEAIRSMRLGVDE